MPSLKAAPAPSRGKTTWRMVKAGPLQMAKGHKEWPQVRTRTQLSSLGRAVLTSEVVTFGIGRTIQTGAG